VHVVRRDEKCFNLLDSKPVNYSVVYSVPRRVRRNEIVDYSGTYLSFFNAPLRPPFDDY